MGRIFRSLIRISAFIDKEIRETLRQPRLIMTLVLGPFLILLLFGVGFQASQRSLRTLFVVQDTNPLRQELEQKMREVHPPLVYMGVTTDQTAAISKLRQGQIDLVVVAPADADRSIRENQPAVFALYYNEIDPFQVDYVNYIGQLYGNELNHRVVVNIATQAQDGIPRAQQAIAAARVSAQALVAALRQGDRAAAQQNQKELAHNLDLAEIAIGSGMALLDTLRQPLGGGTAGSSAAGQLAAARNSSNSLPTQLADSSDQTLAIKSAQQTDQDLAAVQLTLQQIQGINPDILARPFRSTSKGVGAVEPRLVDFFTPSVIALLLQHMALTFAALSVVREYRLGTTELFRVSPLTAGEMIVGKYLGFMLFGGLLALILSALMVWILGVAMLGSWLAYAGVIAALLFASLGFGFVLSMLAQTESQAVQYAMIFLLTSVFFSGFFLRLESLWPPVRVVSYLLPVTYAMPLLQSIALRGSLYNPIFVIGLIAIGTVLLLLAWVLLRRRMSITA